MAIFLLALFTLALAVAMPRVISDLQRDRDMETVHRGKQYIRAIKMYYKKFNAYPPTVDALVKTDNIRFLRKKYVDPTTGKDVWKPILFGQAKTQTLGFFGQPLTGTGSAGGSVLAGTGSSGGNATTTGIGTSDTTDSSLSSTSSSTSSIGSNTNNPTGSGQTFGGAGIVGVSPGSQKKSLIVWKKKNHYNEWEFVYDPLSDMQTISNNTGTGGSTGIQTSSGSSTTTSTPTTGTATNSQN